MCNMSALGAYPLQKLTITRTRYLLPPRPGADPGAVSRADPAAAVSRADPAAAVSRADPAAAVSRADPAAAVSRADPAAAVSQSLL